MEWLTVAGDADAWRSAGLNVGDDGLVSLDGTSLRIVEPGAGQSDGGIEGWSLSGLDAAVASIDGLPTAAVPVARRLRTEHELGATGLDHVVVTTPDLERTAGAIAVATGCPLKRVRETGTMRQGFHRIGRGGLIVELVERPDAPDGPAAFWGVVINVDDLDAACGRLGPDCVGRPRDAVQPGRRIATVRPSCRLGLPVALMSV